MTRIPLKARRSLLWQRIVLTARYAFRLPIDDITDRNRTEMDRQVLDALRSHAKMLNNLNARLHWYETKAPALKPAYKAFCAHQKKLAAAAAKAPIAEMAVQSEREG